MRNRTNRVEIYLTKEELETLTKKHRKANLSREAYLRKLINGSEVKEAPPVDWGSATWELRRIGNNLNQLLVKANSLGFTDAPMLRNALEETHHLEDQFFDLFTMPEA